MLESIRKYTQGWMAKVILALITVPFALFGIDSYLNSAGGDVAVAKVGGGKISVQEYGNAMENVRNRLQSEGQKVDPAMLESPQFKQSVLDGLIARRLVQGEIAARKFKVTDDQLSQHILTMAEFQEKGKFSEDLYQKTLEQNKLTATKFEANLRNDLAMQQARDGLARLAMTPSAVAQSTLQFAHQKRDVSTAEYKIGSFLTQVKVTPEQVKAYYDKNKDKFKSPEQVKLQFALLSVNGLMPQMQVTDEEVKKHYEENSAQYQGNEQRQASHILINAEASASEGDKSAAKAKALDILSQIKKNPKSFEELAVKYSQDPGSAIKGGKLDNFGRGAMTKAFEEAAFSMKVEQISDLVQTEYGYHIIRLDGVTGTSSSFNDIKAQVKADLLYRAAQMRYSELSEEFRNLAYEQSGSLEPIAKKFNLQLQSSGWLSREEGAKFFNSEKFMTSVFSDEVLKEKRNSEALEVTENNLISARVLEYKPSAPRSFDEVKGGIEALLKLEQASKLAKEKGEATLAKLKSGAKDDGLEWIPPVTVDRKNAQGLTEPVMNQVFKINASKLPAYAGFVDGNRAYVLVEVSRVDNALDDAGKTEAEAELQAALGAEYISAYTNSLKAKADVSVNARVLQSDSQQ